MRKAAVVAMFFLCVVPDARADRLFLQISTIYCSAVENIHDKPTLIPIDRQVTYTCASTQAQDGKKIRKGDEFQCSSKITTIGKLEKTTGGAKLSLTVLETSTHGAKLMSSNSGFVHLRMLPRPDGSLGATIMIPRYDEGSLATLLCSGIWGFVVEPTGFPTQKKLPHPR